MTKTTKYFLAKPEPILIYPDREVCNLATTAGMREYRKRTLVMVERQRYLCPICALSLSPEEATFDHETPRGHGGGFRDDRIWVPDLEEGGMKPQNFAVHGLCNVAKGSRRNEVQHDPHERLHLAS